MLLTMTITHLPLFLATRRTITVDKDSLQLSENVSDRLINDSSHNSVKDETIVSSKRMFWDMSQAHTYRNEVPPLSPYKLESFTKSFLALFRKCEMNKDAQISVEGNQYSGIKQREYQKIVEGSWEEVTYWKELFKRDKFISGRLNWCDTDLRSQGVCHVVLKLSLQTDGKSEDIQKYYMVGRLTRDKPYGSFTHQGHFFLVEENALRKLDDGSFELAVEDRRQRLDWTCTVPEAEPVTQLVVRPKTPSKSQTDEDLVATKAKASSASALSMGASNLRCCCYRDANGIHAVGVKVLTGDEEDAQPVAVGHSGSHAGTKNDQACPIIGPSFCACTATGGLFSSWVAKSKCKEGVGIRTHSKGNMGSGYASLRCAAKCLRYEEKITSPCTA